MAIRERLEFLVPCSVVIENGKFKKVLLDCNDWGDHAAGSVEDLTPEEFAMIENKCGIYSHKKLEWDWM
jgi:hypothetical protein